MFQWRFESCLNAARIFPQHEQAFSCRSLPRCRVPLDTSGASDGRGWRGQVATVSLDVVSRALCRAYHPRRRCALSRAEANDAGLAKDTNNESKRLNHFCLGKMACFGLFSSRAWEYCVFSCGRTLAVECEACAIYQGLPGCLLGAAGFFCVWSVLCQPFCCSTHGKAVRIYSRTGSNDEPSYNRTCNVSSKNSAVPE